MTHLPDQPTVVVLCGSSRFPEAFAIANLHESLAGRVVISLGMWGHADQPEGARFLTSDGDESTPEKQGLDQLHFRKIDLADEILVINVGGYVGSSTRREIAYAREHGKRVRWLFPQEDDLDPLASRCDELERRHDVVREALARLRPIARHEDLGTLLAAIDDVCEIARTPLPAPDEEATPDAFA